MSINQQITPRYVRKNSLVIESSHCKLCGTHYGEKLGACPTTTCLACESRQCMENGLGRGQCGICYIGLLPGWSGTNRKCDFKDCKFDAVARADGTNRFRCKVHLERGKWAGYVAKRLMDRDRNWLILP